MAAGKRGSRSVKVSEYLTALIDTADISQKDLAAALGYDRPNIITMFKQGLTKVPLNKIVPLAKALNVDPAHMLRVVLREYFPDMWELIEECLNGGLATRNELEMLEVIRGATNNTNPMMDAPRERELKNWAKTLGK